jgi:hypothetical protein
MVASLIRCRNVTRMTEHFIKSISNTIMYIRHYLSQNTKKKKLTGMIEIGGNFGLVHIYLVGYDNIINKKILLRPNLCMSSWNECLV